MFKKHSSLIISQYFTWFISSSTKNSFYWILKRI